MTEADVEAGVRAALAAEGLDFDALSSAASHHGANAHAAPKAADGFELNGRKLLFDASELLAVKLQDPPPPKKINFTGTAAPNENYTKPDLFGSTIATRLYNINATLNQDAVMNKAVRVFSSIITPANMALFVRMAFHEAGTFNPNAAAGTSEGGSNGSIRFELDWVSNGGLQRFGFPWIWAGYHIMDKAYPGVLSWADCIAIAGATGTKLAGGPYVNVGYGRPDVAVADPFTGVGHITQITKDFTLGPLLADWESYGFTAQELCILSGAHTFGISATSPPQGMMTRPFFTNEYYKNVLAGIGFFTSDKTLATPGGATLECVQKCAASQKYFFKEWEEYFFQMTWWGVSPTVEKKGLSKA